MLMATQRFIELLSNINHEISYKLIENIKYRNSAPISFLDFGSANDDISFVQSNKVIELMEKYGDQDYKMHGWTSKRSSPMKIGRAIKLIYGNHFINNQPKGSIIPKTPTDIETFVNMFKAERDKNENYERFEIVKGEDIKYWYNQDNYSRHIQEDTTLAKSCTRYREAGKYLEMYVKHPDVVNMLILKDDVGRLRGRAIVWHLKEPANRIYMERVYSINDFDVEIFKNYAREQGWLYKSRQTYGFQHNIIDGRNGEEYYWENYIMKSQVEPLDYNYFPYLDTLCVYNRKTGVLSNDGRLLNKDPHIKLSDPQGGYTDNVDHREMVFSNYHNGNIPREESEYVDLDEDWVYSYTVVEVSNTNGKRSHTNSRLIVKSAVIKTVRYFLKDSCVWSEYLKTWIYKDSVKEAYLDGDKKEKVIIHKRLIGRYFSILDNGDIVKKQTTGSSDLDRQVNKKLRDVFESGLRFSSLYPPIYGNVSQPNSTIIRNHPTGIDAPDSISSSILEDTRQITNNGRMYDDLTDWGYNSPSGYTRPRHTISSDSWSAYPGQNTIRVTPDIESVSSPISRIVYGENYGVFNPPVANTGNHGEIDTPIATETVVSVDYTPQLDFSAIRTLINGVEQINFDPNLDITLDVTYTPRIQDNQTPTPNEQNEQIL